MVTVQTGKTLAAWRDRADKDSLTNFVSGDARSDLMHNTNCFVSDDEAGLHRVLTLQNVKVGSADGRSGNTQDYLSYSCEGNGNFIETNVTRAVEDQCSHCGGCSKILSLSLRLGQYCHDVLLIFVIDARPL